MTSSTNFKLTNLFTQETICEDKTQTRNQTLMKMFNASITKIMEKLFNNIYYIDKAEMIIAIRH